MTKAQGTNGNEDFRPIFIVGFPRSGTTLLATLMDRHSRVAVPAETSFFVDVLPCGRNSAKRVTREFLLERLFSTHRISDLRLDRDDVAARLADYAPEYKNLLRAALESYASRDGKTRPGEKSPRHLFYVPLIMEWYPAAKIVCIVRDGRDAVQSLMKVPWYSKKKLAALCAEWNYRSGLIKSYMGEYPGSFKVFRFEDLVGSPEVELERICVFIGEGFEAAQLDTGVASKVVPDWEKGWKSKALTGIDSSRVRAWEKTATVEDKLVMNTLMARWLRHWGYEVGVVDAPRLLSLRIALKAAWYADGLYRLRRSMTNLAILIICRAGIPNSKVKRLLRLK